MKVLVTFLILVSTVSLSAEDREELDRRKNQVATLKAHLDHVDLYFGGFAYVDGNLFRGNKGLVEQAETFNQKSNEWIAGWMGLQQANQLLSQTTPGNLSSLTSKISESLEEQRKLFNELEEIERNVRALGRAVPSSYEEIASPRESSFEAQYRPFVRTLVDQFSEMRSLASRISQEVSANLSRMEAVLVPSENNFLESIRNALAAQGILDLQTAMAAVRKVLLMDKYLGQASSQMSALYEEGDLFARRRMVFHLRKHVKKMADAGDRLKSTASAAGLSGTLLSDVQMAVNRYLNEMNADLVELETDPDAYLVYRAAKKLQRVFKEACENGETQVNCILLNDLSKVSRTQIESMNSNDLESFEMAWDLVGPVR